MLKSRSQVTRSLESGHRWSRVTRSRVTGSLESCHWITRVRSPQVSGSPPPSQGHQVTASRRVITAAVPWEQQQSDDLPSLSAPNRTLCCRPDQMASAAASEIRRRAASALTSHARADCVCRQHAPPAPRSKAKSPAGKPVELS